MDNNAIYALLEALRSDFNLMRAEVAKFTTFMTRVETQEEERNLPAQISAMKSEISALQQVHKDTQSVKTGRMSVWQWFVTIAAALVLLLELIDKAKSLFGK